MGQDIQGFFSLRVPQIHSILSLEKWAISEMPLVYLEMYLPRSTSTSIQYVVQKSRGEITHC